MLPISTEAISYSTEEELLLFPVPFFFVAETTKLQLIFESQVLPISTEAISYSTEEELLLFPVPFFFCS